MSLSWVVFLSLLFPVLSILFFILYRQKSFEGSTIFDSRAVTIDGKIKVAELFSITNINSWYRIRLKFELSFKNSNCIYSSHPYCLILEDESNKIIFKEEKSLADFFYFCWHKNKKTVSECDVVLFEFKPPVSGRYELKFMLKSEEDFSLIDNLTIVLNRTLKSLNKKPYIHQVVDFKDIQIK